MAEKVAETAKVFASMDFGDSEGENEDGITEVLPGTDDVAREDGQQDQPPHDPHGTSDPDKNGILMEQQEEGTGCCEGGESTDPWDLPMHHGPLRPPDPNWGAGPDQQSHIAMTSGTLSSPSRRVLLAPLNLVPAGTASGPAGSHQSPTISPPSLHLPESRQEAGGPFLTNVVSGSTSAEGDTNELSPTQIWKYRAPPDKVHAVCGRFVFRPVIVLCTLLM